MSRTRWYATIVALFTHPLLALSFDELLDMTLVQIKMISVELERLNNG